ncbi:MAG: prephenate dehydratase [Verrucomicrobiota bacterium]
MSDSLKGPRTRIDEIDCKLVKLLDERADLASEIGKAKAADGLPVFDPAREDNVLQRALAESCGSFPHSALRRVFREIISASISIQKRLTVGYLGPESTFTHQAARECFGSSVEFRAFRTIPEIFEAVEKESVDFGVVPVENSIQGSVFATLDCLVDSGLRIIGEKRLRIEHCLISAEPLETITKVYSKDQALGQCRLWLSRHLSKADLIEAPSTAQAVEIASKEAGAAAIASSLSAAEYGLPVIEKGIQDASNNRTRFLVLGRPGAVRETEEGLVRTALVLSLPDEPGALQKALSPFAMKGINLSHIESRPSRKKPWEYLFFIEFSGHERSSPVADVLEELNDVCPFVKILGSFPFADALD